MRKRTYRASGVKALELESLLDRVRGQRVVLGVDISKSVPYGVLMGEDESILAVVKWHQLKETRELVRILGALEASSLEVAMESSGTYGDALRGCLESAGYGVYQVSGKKTRDAGELYDGVPSQHDAKAAAIVAWLHLRGKSRRWRVRSAEDRDLRARLEVLEHHDSVLRASVNRLESRLARYWPELSSLLSLDGVTLLELVMAYGGPAGVREDASGAHRLMRRVGRYFLREQKIEAVLESARCTIGVAMVDAEREALRVLAGEARRAQQLGRRVRSAIRREVRRRPSLGAMREVLGDVGSAAWVTELGPASSYSSAGAYLKSQGLNLKELSSGKRKGQLGISRRGSRRARWWLYFAVLRWIQRDPVVRTWYERKVQRDGGIKHKAIVAVMRKLGKALWHVGQGKAFDVRLLFDTRRLGFES